MARYRQSVVLVEDDPGMAAALARVLTLAGFEVESFASPEDCVASGSAARAGCLVLDVNLPGISGFELQRRLAQAGSKAPVIFITGQDSLAARQQARHHGAVAYLPKPFAGPALVGAVRQAMQPD
jgi:FixJ family two-component response regulator